MEKYLLFISLFQSVILTYFFAKRTCFTNLSRLFLFVFIANFTILNLRFFLFLAYEIKLTNFHLPFCFLAGPNLYHLVKFSFLPNKEISSNKWKLWFLPSIIELLLVGLYWIIYFFDSETAKFLETIIAQFPILGTISFILFFIASVYFLIKNNSFIKMNIMYQKQYKVIKVLVFFILLLLLDDLILPDDSILLTTIILAAFTSYFIFYLISKSDYFYKNDNQNNQILKEALNEKVKPVLITNSDRITEYVNQAFLDLIGYKHKDVIGKKPSMLQGELTTQESIENVRKKLDSKIAFNFDIINYHKSGKAYISKVSITPIFNDAELSHFVAYQEFQEIIAEAQPLEKELILLEKIKAYFETEKPFTNKQLQVSLVAEATEISSRQIGEIIKKYENISFTEFVNQYRIEAAIDLLKNKENHHLTFESISQECGFNSKSSFNIAFKNKTGQTPKQFCESI